MTRDVKDLQVHYDQTTQLPNMIIASSPRAPLARKSARSAPGTPEGAVTEFIRNRADLWQLSPEDTATIEVVSVSAGPADAAPRAATTATRARARSAAPPSTFSIRNLKTVNLIQRVEGKEVFNSDTTAAVNATNEVITVSGQFFPGAASSASRSRAAAAGVSARAANVTSAEEAIARAAFDLTNAAYSAADFSRAVDPPDSGSYRFYDYKGTDGDQRPSFDRPVRLKDVMFPLGDGQFVPGYYLELWIKGFPPFSYVMDAVDTPDVLYRKNLTSHVAFKYRVHNTGDAVFRPHDGPAPGTPHPAGVPERLSGEASRRKADRDREPAVRGSMAAARSHDHRWQQLYFVRGPRSAQWVWRG